MAYTTINKPNLHFNTVTWAGDSTTPKTITGVGFQPDLIWGKDRSQPYSHQVYDTVRGFGDNKELTPNSALAEGGQNADTYGYLSGVTADGFTAVKGSDAAGYDYWNESPDTYVAWNWKANGAGVANTAGTISSTVSANTTAGFSIVSYTGTGSTATVGHGLGAVPKMIILKDRDASDNWNVYTSMTGNNSHLHLNLTNAKSASSTYWNTTTPTSSLFSLGSTSAVNANGNDFIAYCFAELKGYSKF